MKISKNILVMFCSLVLTGFQNNNGGWAAGCQLTEDSPNQLASHPPMGWNSYDCFGWTVSEDEVKANAVYISEYLLKYGWEYVVIDFCWSSPFAQKAENPDQDENFFPALTMDEFGRLLPSVERFPSAVNGLGFKPLADYVHALGLKFGIHIMRGIPRQAVKKNLPILGIQTRAAAIADTASVCRWLNHMYGINMNRNGAQAYYDSIFQLYTEWGVDYVKVDDMLFDEGPQDYHVAEIEAIHLAVKKCGRTMIISLSPGPAPLEQADHLKKYATMWRISDDFWDSWDTLKEQFDLCRAWAPYIQPGHWPDADMIPFGKLSKRGPNGKERYTNFTRDEQYSLMTLWSIFRSPLMLGGNLPENDEFTLSLITNDEVLSVNQNSILNREFCRNDQQIVWIADLPDLQDKYVALFNISDENKPQNIKMTFQQLGLSQKCRVRDLWKHENLGIFEDSFSASIRPHGAGFFRISNL
jgi:alpha-galactosidase